MRTFLHIMEATRLEEWGQVVPGVNTSVDVGPGEIATQAAKFGNDVSEKGVPPLLMTQDEDQPTEEKLDEDGDDGIPDLEVAYQSILTKGTSGL
jgi:hypothetical protein